MTSSTTLIDRPATEQDTILITVTPQVIQETIDGMMLLKIEGIDDKQGRELVSTARKQVVKLRTTAESERVLVKSQALEECRRIDKQWKDLFALIEPVENYLKLEEKKIADAEAKIELEKRNKLIQSRMESLERVGVESMMVNSAHIGSLSDDQFTEYRLRLAQQVSEQREAAKKIAAERAELEKAQAQQREQQAELARQQEELAAKQREFEQAEYQRRREESSARLREQQKQLAAKLAPDHTKLLGVIDQLSQIEIPEVSSEAQYAKTQITNALQAAYDQITQVLNGMVV